MTICIAGITERSKIVAITDKMLTIGAPVTTKFEVSGNDKAIKISEKVVALFAGDVIQANEILTRAKVVIDGKTDVREISEAVVGAYKEQYKFLVTEHLLSKFGITLDIFMANHRNFDAEMVRNVTDTISKYNLDAIVIVAGIDTSPHIYQIASPGVLSCYDSVGYACIGSGSQHAMFSLIESEYSGDMEKAKSIYSLIEAKKRAEYDPGVGQLCDLVIIDSEVKKIPTEKINLSMKKYNSHAKRIRKTKEKNADIMLKELDI